MAAICDEEMESLLRSFDEIHQDQRDMVVEIRSLRLALDSEIERREALESACDDLKSDNERLKKFNIESLSRLAVQLEFHTQYQSLKEKLQEANKRLLHFEKDHAKEKEDLRENCHLEIEELQKQISGYLALQSQNELMITALQKDLAARKSQTEILNNRLKQVKDDLESKYSREIQDLRDWVMVEQQEKNALQKALEIAQNELQSVKATQAEQQQESISIRHVETLKQKVMKLRQENESLKRQLAVSHTLSG